MRTLRFLATASLISWLAAPSLQGATLQVALELGKVSRDGSLKDTAEPIGPTEAILKASLLEGSLASGTSGSREWTVQVPGSVSIDLPAQSVWRLKVEAQGMWAPETVVTLADSGTLPIAAAKKAIAQKILLWPQVELTGTVKMPRGEHHPAELSIRFEPAPGSNAEGLIEITKQPCSIKELSWSCKVPTILSDLRFRVPGFVSHYLWDVDLVAKETFEIGTLELRRGAAVVGWVEASDGKVDPEKCTVELRRTAAGEGVERLEKLAVSTKITERGFFHFKGVDAGSYSVAATRPGSAVAEFHPINVMAGAETSLLAPLVLEPPMVLEARVLPAADLAGDPWHIELVRFGKIPGQGDILQGGVTSTEGVFVRRGLSRDRYLVSVLNSAGDQMASEMVELTPETSMLEIVLDVVPVDGTVRIGGEPLVADILFGGPYGEKTVKIPSDDEGSFFGYLPEAGEWLVLIESESPKVSSFLKVQIEKEADGIARVQLEVPNTELSGVVLDERGKEIERVLVKAFDPAADATSVAVTDHEGRFSFHGLPIGSTTVWGEHLKGDVSPIDVPLAEDAPVELRMVLQESDVVSGQIVSSTGGVVPGALLHAWGYNGSGKAVTGSFSKTTTDVQGDYHLELMAGVETFQITVFPPGYALKAFPFIARHQLEEEVKEITVDALGGTVLLEFDDHFDWQTDDLRPWLFFEGAPISFSAMQSWRSIQMARDPSKSTLTVPSLPPGHYRACLIKTMADLGHPEACGEGFLGPSSELRIALRGSADEDG